MAKRIENNVLQFLSSRKTLVMATIDKNGAPNASYAPFVTRTPWLYVYTSARSKHTQNLTETTRASVMFIEDETRSGNLFARKRFTSQCRVEVVERESKEWRTVMSLFKKKFGKVFAMIRPLPDFTLFRLIPSGGLYVYGFGQALEVTWPPTKASAEIAASIRPVAIEKPA